MTPAQTALRNGTRRAVDGVTRRAGEIDLSHTPRAYCMSDADAEAALARGRAARQRADAYRSDRPEPEHHRPPVEPTAIDHYEAGNLLSERQVHAAKRLARLYEAGRPRVGRVTADLTGQPGGKGDMTEFQSDCWRDYCNALKGMPPRCSHAVAQLAAGDYPKMVGGLGYLREGLDALCAYWGAEAKKIIDARRSSK